MNFSPAPLLAALLTLAVPVAHAQLLGTPPAPPTPAPVSAGSSSLAMPDVQRPGGDVGATESGLLSGDQPFILTVARGGIIEYNFNEDRAVESITAKVGVVFSSNEMTLNCDQLDYYEEKSLVVATGRKVIVQQGEVIATCQLFRYDATTQKSELAGSPILYNKTRDGKVSATAGERILISVVDGRPQVQVIAGGSGASMSGGGAGVPGRGEGPNESVISNQARAIIIDGDTVTTPGGVTSTGTTTGPAAALIPALPSLGGPRN